MRRLLILPAALTTLAVAAGCASGPSATAAAVAMRPTTPVVVEMDPPSFGGVGVRVYDRMFDFLLDQATAAPVHRRAPVPDSAATAGPVVRVDSLRFELDDEPDQLMVGAFREGRRSLVARLWFDASAGDHAASGWAKGSTLIPREGDIVWQDYLGALTALADDLAGRAALPPR